MTHTIYLIVGFIATAANAGFVWQDDDDASSDDVFKKFPHINFPNFPQFPQFTFPDFPAFPTIQPIVFPKPHKGFNGVAVNAASSASIGKDGKVYKSGGATVVTSKDGVVKKVSGEIAVKTLRKETTLTTTNYYTDYYTTMKLVGDDPSNKDESPPTIIIPQVHIWHAEFPAFMTMDADTLKSSKSGKNEHFVSSSASAFSSTSSKNGVSYMEGAANVVQNVDGKIDEKTIRVTDNEV